MKITLTSRALVFVFSYRVFTGLVLGGGGGGAGRGPLGISEKVPLLAKTREVGAPQVFREGERFLRLNRDLNHIVVRHAIDQQQQRIDSGFVRLFICGKAELALPLVMCTRSRCRTLPKRFPFSGAASAPTSIQSSTGTSVSLPFSSALNLALRFRR